MAEFESIWSDLQGVSFSQGYLDVGGVRTRYLQAGDRVRMEVLDAAGRSVFGAIDQRVRLTPD